MQSDRHWGLLAALLTAALHVGDASAQLSVADRAAVARYQSALRSAQAGSQPALEAAFAALAALRQALLRVRGGQSVLESLTDQEFAGLQRKLPGTLVNREEVVLVAPDTKYFGRLAARHGDAADQAFFRALKRTSGQGVWPVYVEQQTDTTGCTRFGSMSLLRTYRVWDGFRRSHPGRYAAAAEAKSQAVLDELAEATCACGDLAQVESELQRFLQAFPYAPKRADIERRLDAVKAGRSDIRAHCRSG